MPDALVPYSFALAGLLYFFTGNVQRASAALMADYSCAIKLATPLTILTAMRSGVRQGVLIKGGKFLEGLASVDTVVFDKTGTLTVSTPRVSKVLPMEGYSRDEILKIRRLPGGAFPPLHGPGRWCASPDRGAQSTRRARSAPIVVAHGIRSSLHGKQASSAAPIFIFEDEGIHAPRPEKRIEKRRGADSDLSGSSATRGRRICIEDPPPEARDV